MKSSRALLASTFLFAAGQAAAGSAHEFTIGDMTIDHPWARETAASQKNGAAYFTINNPTTSPDKLISANSEVAERVELHTHLMEDGVIKMREVESIEVPAEGAAKLEPGGLHVMLLGLESPLVEGEVFPLMLEFENAGSIEITVNIEDVSGPDAKSMKMDHSHHGDAHSTH